MLRCDTYPRFVLVIFAVAQLFLMGCFGGDKMMQIKRQCREVIVATNGSMWHVRLIHQDEWVFAEGFKKEGVWEGECLFYRPDGSLYATVTYREGQLVGRSASYYTNGQVAVVGVLMQNRDGIGVRSTEIRCFDPDGHPVSEAQFRRAFLPLVTRWLYDSRSSRGDRGR